MESIFSTYSTGENRVTASLLAVLRSLSLDRIERLLRTLLEDSDFDLVRFENQPAKGGKGVPDAIIHASIRLLVETKIEPNSVNGEQVNRHLRRLDGATEAIRLLLIITPDAARPSVLNSLNNERIVWTSFADLDQAINSLLADVYEVTSDREVFLLRELQKMLAAEGLLASHKDVLIVAARNAWPEYQEKFHAYVCQPNRTFRKVERLAFYSHGRIHPLVPKILESHEEVVMTAGQQGGALGDLVQRLIKENWREKEERYKVLLLSAPDSPDTIHLPGPIVNDWKTKEGKATAFTMGHRYTTVKSLCTAKTTSDLD